MNDGILIDLATGTIIYARPGDRYEWDPERGEWMRAPLAEGMYIGPDPNGSGSTDSTRRANNEP